MLPSRPLSSCWFVCALNRRHTRTGGYSSDYYNYTPSSIAVQVRCFYTTRTGSLLRACFTSHGGSGAMIFSTRIKYNCARDRLRSRCGWCYVLSCRLVVCWDRKRGEPFARPHFHLPPTSFFFMSLSFYWFASDDLALPLLHLVGRHRALLGPQQRFLVLALFRGDFLLLPLRFARVGPRGLPRLRVVEIFAPGVRVDGLDPPVAAALGRVDPRRLVRDLSWNRGSTQRE